VSSGFGNAVVSGAAGHSAQASARQLGVYPRLRAPRHDHALRRAAIGPEGRVIGQCYPRLRHQEFLIFLRRLEAEFPGGKTLHLTLANYGTHGHARALNPESIPASTPGTYLRDTTPVAGVRGGGSPMSHYDWLRILMRRDNSSNRQSEN